MLKNYNKPKQTHNRYLFFINKNFVVFQVAIYPLLHSIEIHYKIMQTIMEQESMRRMKRKLMLYRSALSASRIGHYKTLNLFLYDQGYKKAEKRIKLSIVYLYNTLCTCIVSKKAAMFNIYKRIERYS